MRTLKQLFKRNREWATRIRAEDPQFFTKLSHQQKPQYFWIGCSDSRVPANQITGLLPGEMFVHRNIANIVPPADINSLSTLEFAVDVLKVRHIIVCGHYGCSGVKAVLQKQRIGLADHWLRNVEIISEKHAMQLNDLPTKNRQFDRLCELNVIEQAFNVSKALSVQDAWRKGQTLSVHGWIYAVKDGLLRNLGFCVTRPDELEEAYQTAIEHPAKE